MRPVTTAPVCGWCGEPIEERHGGDAARRTWANLHRECAQRSVVGGVNHQRGTCTCCGGTDEPDPGGLTRREAAIASAFYWEAIDHAADILALRHPSMNSTEWLATLMPERGDG